MQEYSEEENNEEEEKQAQIDKLAAEILKKRDEAVSFRAASGVEERWREAESLFDGVDSPTNKNRTAMIDYATGQAPVKDDGNARRSKVIVNLIRPKCETAIGRFSDIQLPVDDKNWGGKITPVPELSKALKDDRQAAVQGQPVVSPEGKPVTISDVAKSDHERATDKMKSMEQEIDDQLTECEYNSECRKAITQACKLGTGIMKGPNVIKKVRKVWQKDETGGYSMQISEDHKPSSQNVLCWNVYPAPECEEDVKKSPYFWEKQQVLARDLRNLIGVKGYLDDQIRKVLSEDPIKTSTAFDDKNQLHHIYRAAGDKTGLYERWDYYGDITRDDLEALGVDVEKYMDQSFSACIVFVNDRPIKAQINVLDSGDMPYDFFTWSEVSGSPWGMGLPEQGKWPQRIATAGLRAMMDNSGDSSGANIVIGAGVHPANDLYEITGKKIWLADADVEDVRKVFQQFQIANNQEALQAVIELAIKFLDMETAMPMLFQGEKGEAPETLGATNIMVDANNVSLRSRVKRFDDMITRPHIKRYYDWNMQYSEKENIKGDFEIDVRGATVLMEKDQHAQILLQLLPMLSTDPDMRVLVNRKRATKKLLDCLKLSDVLNTEDEQAEVTKNLQNQQPQQDPRVAAAQIKVQGDMEKAKLVQQSDMAEIKEKADSGLEDRRLRAEDAERDRQHERQMKEMEMNMKMMELSQSQNISLAEIKSVLSRDAMKLKAQFALAGPDKKGPQVANPVVEPEGKADEGRAYQD